MFREDLEHLIRAACAAIEQNDVIVIGSQAVLGTYGPYELPEITTLSVEADVLPIRDSADEHLATVIDGAIGEMSPFHQQYGTYAQGVGPRTAFLPQGWADRLVPVTGEATGYRVGWCLEVHDLCVAKLLAYRTKDLAFVRSLIGDNLVSVTTLHERLSSAEVDEQRRQSARAFLDGFDNNADSYVEPPLPVVDLDAPSHPRHRLEI